MANVYLAIGSNLSDRQANIDRALTILKEDPDIDVIKVSSFIETEPVGDIEGKFLNGALQVETELLPLELLSRLKGVERRLGRKKDVEGPRTMDLDILFYDDVVIAQGKSLTIPHPRAAERLFVLQPLMEIAPDFVHPRLKKSIRELYESIASAPHESSPNATSA